VLRRDRESRVVLVAPLDAPLARWHDRALTRLGLVVADPHLSDWQLHGRLAGVGPLDLLIVGDSLQGNEIDRFRTLFLLVRNGGDYVVPGFAPQAVERLTRFLGDLTSGDDESLPPSERTFLASAVAQVRREHGQLTVTRHGRTLAKLREAEMNEALAADPSRGRVLATVPAMEFDSRCVLRSSGRAREDRTKERYSAPELYLRVYLDVSCRPKSVVIQRGVLCPDTYRHHLGPRLRHKSLTDAGPRFAVTPRNEPPTRHLEGTYFHLDNEIRGFFGHALTEQVSRLWAWEQAKKRYPDIKVLLSLNRGREVADWELTLLEAGGIDRSDVVVIAKPTRVERLLSATPMFSMPAYVHPRIVETWDSVGSALREQASERSYPSRVFCSRHHDRRGCLNRDEVEALFVGHGFEVVLPEELTLPDQAALFDHADVIGGFAGSGMFTSMFTDRPKHLIMVTPDTYGPSNESMISAVRGHRLDVAVGRSTSQRTKEALRAPFTFDMVDEGAWLNEILDDL
jgi:capsular polysaccharide biosynthesis protein